MLGLRCLLPGLFKSCLKAAMLIHLALAWNATETPLPETAGSKPGVRQSFALESLIQTHIALQALRHDRNFAMQIFQGENKGYRLRILLTILFCLTGARCEVKCLPQIEQQRRFKTRCFTESARATLLQRGGASRGSSTESARATLLQRGGASRGSSTEPAKAAGLLGG